jgi:hypothetical protein
MRFFSGACFAVAVALSLGSMGPVRAGGKEDNTAKFETVDGVKLRGTYLPSTKGAKAACVLLVHDFDVTKGGDSHQDGWDSLAKALQAKGYAVLSFDFRGFGRSDTVNPGEFWKWPHNKQGVRGFNPAKPKETISHKDFPPTYYPHLIEDLIAAKAFLDAKNDAKDLNDSNLIVIAAGQGATIAAMWMNAEGKRIASPRAGFPPPPNALPEGRDLTAGIFLSISPTLAGQAMPIRPWLKEVGKEKKVPLAFVYGTDDDRGNRLALELVRDVVPSYSREKPPAKKDQKFTTEHGIKGSKLKGSQLLTKQLDTETWILRDYLEPLMDKHGLEEWRQREDDKAFYYWVLGPGRLIPAKTPLMQRVPFPVEAMIGNR